ncbi:hypothetical protein ACE6H2_028708 [Prunus campanulata]
MSEDMQKSNVKSPIPNASVVMNEDLKQLEKEYCEAKTASYVLSNAPGQDVSASGTGSVPHDPKAITGDADECFLVKELTQDEKKQPQAGENHEEIQAIDAKIRQWKGRKRTLVIDYYAICESIDLSNSRIVIFPFSLISL